MNGTFNVSHPTPTEFFFAGTDTEVGKTYVASLAARAWYRAGKRVGVYKPVASGCIEQAGKRVSEDAMQLWQAAGEPKTLEDVCPQQFLAPLAPPEAAAKEAAIVDPERLVTGVEIWRADSEIVIVEGAGGMFSPLADGVLNIDLVERLGVEVILVAANRLGVIHQTLSCVEAAAHRGITIKGIVLCQVNPDTDDSKATNASQIQRYCKVPILASVEYGAKSMDDLVSLAHYVD